MVSAWEYLISSLVARNVSLAQISELLEDVFGIIADGGMFTVELVNVRLEQLEWYAEVLDETTFQLIVYILKSEWGYRVRHYML